jgi:hypothetical protein
MERSPFSGDGFEGNAKPVAAAPRAATPKTKAVGSASARIGDETEGRGRARSDLRARPPTLCWSVETGRIPRTLETVQ